MKKSVWIVIVTGIAVAIFSALLPMATEAAVPQLMNYQGRLNDNAGAPVDGTKSIVFKLYTASTGGALLWTETQNVTVTNGAFNAMLGSITLLPVSVFDSAAVWLGIAVAGDPEMTPRQQIASAGYAIRAIKADNVSSSNTIVSTMPTGIAPFQVSSTTQVANLNADMVDGYHGTDFVRKTGDSMSGTLSLPILFLPLTSSSQGMISFANGARIHTYGSASNFFAGYYAGNFTLTGSDNTGIGVYSLGNSSSGFANTALGSVALQSNTSGNYNTALGFAALRYSTGASSNTAVGSNAGINQSTGNNNIYLGANVYGTAGESNVTRIGNGQTQTYIAGTLNGDGGGLKNVVKISTSTSGATTFIGTSCTNYSNGYVTIAVPSSGVIMVDADAWIYVYHTYGIQDSAAIYLGSSTTDCGGTGTGMYMPTTVPQYTATGAIHNAVHVMKSFSVSGAGTYTYYLNGSGSGNSSFFYDTMRAVFYAQ